jgi:hypothetical protein
MFVAKDEEKTKKKKIEVTGTTVPGLYPLFKCFNNGIIPSKKLRSANIIEKTPIL